MASTIESSVSCYPTSNNTRKRRRPPYSYTALIAQAIISSEHQQLTLRQIYDSINQMYPQMCQGPDIGWQNTIRHNLSLNQCFKRIPRQQLPISLSSSLRGRGSYWSVD
ncbi:winged helix DNA-binding domain-containing protein, partial [Coemansia reversa NRRL 1564]